MGRLGRALVIVALLASPRLARAEPPNKAAAPEALFREERDPRTHTVEAAALGFKRSQRKVDVTASGSAKVDVPSLDPEPVVGPLKPNEEPQTVEVRLPRSPGPPRSSPRRMLGWVGIGVGSAALAGGFTAGVVAKSNDDAATSDGHCTTRDGDARGQKLVDNAANAATVSTARLVGGGVVAVVGSVLVLTAPTSKGSARPPQRVARAVVEGRF